MFFLGSEIESELYLELANNEFIESYFMPGAHYTFGAAVFIEYPQYGSAKLSEVIQRFLSIGE